MEKWTEENEAELETVFQKFDTDGDGKIIFDEMREHCLKNIVQLCGNNPTDTEIKEYCDKMDTDGDGAVTKDEMRNFAKEFMRTLADPIKRLEAAIEVLMKALDKDENGLIDKEEFRVFMKEQGQAMTDKQLDEVFHTVNTDGDLTTLNKQELLTLLQIGLASQQ